jgi:hypothetical protein
MRLGVNLLAALTRRASSSARPVVPITSAMRAWAARAASSTVAAGEEKSTKSRRRSVPPGDRDRPRFPGHHGRMSYSRCGSRRDRLNNRCHDLRAVEKGGPSRRRSSRPEARGERVQRPRMSGFRIARRIGFVGICTDSCMSEVTRSALTDINAPLAFLGGTPSRPERVALAPLPAHIVSWRGIQRRKAGTLTPQRRRRGKTARMGS